MYTIVVICCLRCFFVFKQKTAYEMRISDWSSDVCSSDLAIARSQNRLVENGPSGASTSSRGDNIWMPVKTNGATRLRPRRPVIRPSAASRKSPFPRWLLARASGTRSEEHTSELQSLMRISYAVFCLKKKKHKKENRQRARKLQKNIN